MVQSTNGTSKLQVNIIMMAVNTFPKKFVTDFEQNDIYHCLAL
jgi:hypothetical protein